MLFVYQYPQVLEFWMKDTRIPLSIAFIGENRRIREIFDMQPNPSDKIYRSTSKMRYALEVNQGWFDANGVTVGDDVRFQLPADLRTH